MTRRGLDQRITELFDQHGPVITLDDADRSGVPRDVLRRATTGLLTKIGKSAFVTTSTLEAADQWERHRLRSIGFILGVAPEVHLTGPSAQAVLRLPSVISPPDVPMARRPGSAHRGPDRTPHGRIRTGFLPPAHCWVRDRARVASLAYTSVDASRYGTAAEALILIDHALARGISKEHLARIATDLINYPGIRRAEWAIAHGDGRAESPLESLGRLAFLEQGRPAPLSNVWISDGVTAYRVDHLLPESGVVLEGDGGIKLNNRSDAHQVMRRQVRRESWLRSKGFLPERYDFAMAMHRRAQILRMTDDAVRQRGSAPVPTCWSLDRPAHLSHPAA